MSSSNLPGIPSFRKQHLFLEFATLKLRCPTGIYLSFTPGDPSWWSGVFFVRTGPYSPAALRIKIAFPSQYPDLPPLVTFATDIFHPLLVPLTTYTFSTSASDANKTVSASDGDRLPPGGFSLRDGFPQWFGQEDRATRDAMDSGGRVNRSRTGSRDVSSEPAAVPLNQEVAPMSQRPLEAAAKPPAIVEVLAYMKSTFEDPTMLDHLPLEAAGNPGAWHAWRSHRGFSKAPSKPIGPAGDERSPGGGSQTLPGNWNWEGVWENRVRIGMENSLSDPVLYGPKGGRGGDKRPDMIRFSKMDPEQLKEICDGVIAVQSTSSKT